MVRMNVKEEIQFVVEEERRNSKWMKGDGGGTVIFLSVFPHFYPQEPGKNLNFKLFHVTLTRTKRKP